MRQSWGNDGRLANRRLEVTATSVRLSSLTYQYDNSDNITGITDTLDASKSRTFGYDPVERLARMNGAIGAFAREDYLHDDNGNRLSVERRTTVNAATPTETDTYTIAPGTNRLTSITGAAGTRSFTHDARGNLIGETRPSGAPVTVAYDGRARLTGYTVGTASQTMLYNGADERIRVITTPASGPTDTRQFVYDLDHRIVGEYGAGGNTDLKAEYIWLLPEVGAAGPTGGDDGTGGYMPLAVAVGVAGQSGITSEVQWVHANHLGTPILTTNASGQAVTPYGYAAIGFPGQFAGALLLPGAEHYYNRYRDYDPTTGRYIQADPIGLAGDENAWVYAGANPLTGIDPEGLEFLNLFPNKEPDMQRAAKKWYDSLPPEVQKAQLHIAGHGSAHKQCVGTSCMNSRDFQRWLRKNMPRSAWGKPINLMSCNTGSDPLGFAFSLAQRMQVPVTAPTTFVWYKDGTGIVGINDKLPWWLGGFRDPFDPGQQVTFYPRSGERIR